MQLLSKISFAYTRYVCVLLMLFILSIKDNLYAQNFSKVSTSVIPPLTNAKAEWLDINNDNRLDLFITGVNSLGVVQTSVYINNGTNTFNVISLTPLTDIAYDFGDYNKDTYTDIIISGRNTLGEKKTILYRNNNGTAFIAESISLENLSKGSILWEDLDNDTDLDLILSGVNSANQEKVIMYEYKNNTYSVANSVLPQVSNGQLISIDINNDGFKEVLITGINANGSPVSSVYTFKNSLQPVLFPSAINGIAFNSITTNDFNQDGFEDILTAGLEGETLSKKTSLLLNNQVNGFINTSAGLQDISSASVDAADINNDGFTDIILTGIDDNGLKHFKYYRNNSATSFNLITNTIANIYNGDVALADYDNDGDIDFFQIGNSDIAFQANLYASDQSSTVINNPPAVPINLSFEFEKDSVYLFWNSSTDDLTNSNSLTYNLYISKAPNATQLLVSPLSDIATGFRKIMRKGNGGYKTNKSFHNLPEGRYYWSVQAIDNSYKASDFASEQSFAICYPISLGKDTTICYNDVLELDMGTSQDQVDWYSKSRGLLVANSNHFSYKIVETDTIVVALTRPFNCTVTDTLVVTMSPLPVVNLGMDRGVCEGKSISLSITTPADSVNWYDLNGLLLKNSISYSYTVNAENTIIAEVFNQFKCVFYDTVVIDVLPLPQFDIGSDREICLNETTTFNVAGSWKAVNWKAQVADELLLNSNAFNFNVTAKDTIIAQVEDNNGCLNYDSAVVDVLPLPVISLGSDQSVCYEQTAVIHLTGTGSDITWLDTKENILQQGVSSYSYQVLTKDTTIVKVTDAKGCISYDSVVVNMLSLPVFDIGADTAICNQNHILLNAGAGFQRVDWMSKDKGTILKPDSWFFDYKVLETDTVIAKVEDRNGCISYDSIEIVNLALPVFTLGNDIEICYKNSVTFQIPGAWKTVNWYTENNLVLENNKTSLSFTPEVSLPVYVEVQSLDKCVNYDSINITVLPLPEFDLGAEKVYCAGDVATIQVPDIGSDYKWTNKANDLLHDQREYSFSAQNTLRIFLTVTDSKLCTYSDSLDIKVNPLPVFEILGKENICKDDTIQLAVEHESWKSINWYRSGGQPINENIASIQIPLAETTIIFASVTDQNNCTDEQSKEIIVYERPVADAGPDLLLCNKESVQLGNSTVVPGNSYEWAPATFLSSTSIHNPVVSPDHTISYALKVTNVYNCSSFDSLYIEVNPQIIVDAGRDAAICIGNTLKLGGTPTASGSRFSYMFQWMKDNETLADNTSNPIVKPDRNATYYVMVTSGKCSVEIDSIEVTVNPLPEVTIIPDQSIGAGGSVELSASGGLAYRWTPEETLDMADTPTPVASPLKSTLYSVIVTDNNNCSDTATVNVFVQNKIFIPTLFTPNEDGSNDVFKIYGSGIYKIELKIHDQNGNELFYSNDRNRILNEGWDGRYKGKVLKDDVYIWTINGSFYNGESVSFEGRESGVVKLMR